MIETTKQLNPNSYMQHLFAASLIAVTLLLQLAGFDVVQALRYERVGIFSGQIWRLFSAHFVHLGWAHFSINIAAFIMIWFLFWAEWQQRIWLLMFIFISLGTSMGLLLLQPSLDWSVGLSGVLHGLFAAGAIGALNKEQRPALFMLSILAVKLVWEQVGAMPGSEAWIGGSVITSAHLYGAASGAIVALCLLGLNKIRFYLRADC